jgi:hypothetical protein
MTVARLRQEMTQSEYAYWTRWWARKWQAEELERLRHGV